MNAYDVDYRTPLHQAASIGNLEIVHYLIEKGAYLAQDTFGNIPIHDAKRNNHTKIIELLKHVPLKTDHKHVDRKSSYSDQMANVNEIILKTGIFSSIAI